MSEAGEIRAVVLCGGSGTRLWPTSREAFPKQFVPLIDKRSTFQDTILRVTGFSGFGRPLVVANKAYRFLIERQLAEIQVDADLLLEPCSQDSGPAIVAASLHLARQSPDVLALVLAADHVVLKPEAFRKTALLAVEAANAGSIVTFGITPTTPATGYGYIEPGEAVYPGVDRVKKFVEKPNAAKALEYIRSGFLWNSGNFMFRPDVMISEYMGADPSSVDLAARAVSEAGGTPNAPVLNEEYFSQTRKVSIDYAVMERTAFACVAAGDFGWSDIGGWEALWDVSEKDESGNATKGDVFTLNTKDSYISTESQLVATVGVQNLVVVATPDAVLVADRAQSADVKELVNRLKSTKRQEATVHARVYRPWGWYQTLARLDRFLVKRIVVYPGEKLSLQKHYHRAEHWVVVRGTVRVIIEDSSRDMTENQSTYVPLGAVHRLENPGRIEAEIIEVQTGSYLDESDILRLHDVYDRE